MTQGGVYLVPLCGYLAALGGEVRLGEHLADVGDGRGRGVRHVGVVEAVVAQVVHENFVGGEVVANAALALQPVDGQQQGGLAQLVAVCPVAEVAYGAHREEQAALGQSTLDVAHDGEPAGHDVVDCEELAREGRGRLLVAVGHYLAGCVEPVDVGAAPGDDDAVGRRQTVVSRSQAAVDVCQCAVAVGAREAGVVVVAVPQPAGEEQVVGRERCARDDALPVAGDRLGVVQRAERVDVDVEFALLQPRSQVLDKARAQQQQVLPVVQIAGVTRRVDDSSEIHGSRSISKFKISYFLTDLHTILTPEKIKKYNM